MDVNRASGSRAISPLRGSIQSHIRIVTHRTPEGDSIDTKIACPQRESWLDLNLSPDAELSTDNFYVKTRKVHEIKEQEHSFISKFNTKAVSFVDFELVPEKKFTPIGYENPKKWYEQARILENTFNSIYRKAGLSFNSALQLETAFQIRQNGFTEPLNKEILETLKIDDDFIRRIHKMGSQLQKNGAIISSYSIKEVKELNEIIGASLWSLLPYDVKKKYET